MKQLASGWRGGAQQKVRSAVPQISPSDTPNVLSNVGASSDTPTEVGDAPQRGGGGGHQNDSPSVLRQQRGKEAEDTIRRTEILIENHTRVSDVREGTPGTPMLVREAPQWRGVVQDLHGFFARFTDLTSTRGSGLLAGACWRHAQRTSDFKSDNTASPRRGAREALAPEQKREAQDRRRKNQRCDVC